MIDQNIINWAMGGVGALLGFVLNAVWQAVKDLQVADKELAEKVGSIEVLVVGAYMKKEEMYSILGDLKADMAHSMGAVSSKLDRIEDKIDKKVDRSEQAMRVQYAGTDRRSVP